MNAPEEPAKQATSRRQRWISVARMASAAAAAPPAAFFTWTYTDSLTTAMEVLTLGFALVLYIWYESRKPAEPPHAPQGAAALPTPGNDEP